MGRGKHRLRSNEELWRHRSSGSRNRADLLERTAANGVEIRRGRGDSGDHCWRGKHDRGVDGPCCIGQRLRHEFAGFGDIHRGYDRWNAQCRSEHCERSERHHQLVVWRELEGISDRVALGFELGMGVDDTLRWPRRSGSENNRCRVRKRWLRWQWRMLVTLHQIVD